MSELVAVANERVVLIEPIDQDYVLIIAGVQGPAGVNVFIGDPPAPAVLWFKPLPGGGPDDYTMDVEPV